MGTRGVLAATKEVQYRLDKLEPKAAEPWTITVWLHHLDGRHMTGPDGQTITVEEADRLTADYGLVIDLRKART